MNCVFPLLFGFLLLTYATAQDLPQHLPDLNFHLTAQSWKPSGILPADYLQSIEGMCRVAQKHQREDGAIIDPYLHREHQYSTPYFAHAVGTLINADVATDLLPSGIKAMEHATICFAAGYKGIPDAHGEFFISPLVEALDLYKPFVDQTTQDTWLKRLQTPLNQVMTNMHGRLNNWRTYAMKGEWQRAKRGLIPEHSAIAFIEKGWLHWTQRERIMLDKWNLYQDWSSDPQSHAVEAVGRGNLVTLLGESYQGPSGNEISEAVRRGSHTSLLLQSPAGQCPPNGRTDDHVFNDILYLAIFHSMGRDALTRGQSRLASQYVRAANLAYRSIQRWKREDVPWKGSFYITKNYFDPGERVGYQPASQWGNYSGAMMFHLAEAYHVASSDLPEQPCPAEIGGYAFTTDAAFSTFVANAGGMQVFINLRGATVPKYGLSWTPLGVVRFSKAGWDDRLGPSDGEHLVSPDASKDIRQGLTFGPIWKEGDTWIHLAERVDDYRITPEVEFVHPLLVKFSLTYHYKTGSGGPYFKQEYTVTPDGILTKLFPLQPIEFGLSVPLLVNDGRPLMVEVDGRVASTCYRQDSDRQHFLGLNEDVAISLSKDSIQSTYGWLKSARFSTSQDTLSVYIYPQKKNEPSGEVLLEGFEMAGENYTTISHRVDNLTYVGQTSTGGEAKGVDINKDGALDVRFDQVCQFIAQLNNHQVATVEADRDVNLFWRKKKYTLKPFVPLTLK
ncbi:MAG: hypothetical protein HKN87_05705 [Saprospiraceae bacterium]|nr:hypothetical protein [Saprospiraceae bacterium]